MPEHLTQLLLPCVLMPQFMPMILYLKKQVSPRQYLKIQKSYLKINGFKILLPNKLAKMKKLEI